jgi:alpha-beta hydrolase superfamily lysophospholipase
MTDEWNPDVLGDGFEQLTLPLGEDNEGPLVATLVRHLPERRIHLRPLPLGDVDVLYIHGWSDYFFNRRLARWWADRGARFYALDLRKYGRSLRDGQTPGYITDLTDYDAEIAAALEAMGREIDGSAERRLVLLGHSTGGLTLSLWADRHRGIAHGVILNSPWLEFQLNAATRAAIAPVLGLHSRLRPFDNWPQADLGFYSRAQAEAFDPDDPYEIDQKWRPERTMTVHIGWINAVLAGHAHVAAGLHIDAPVCVMLSARTALPTAWSEDLTRTDSVLIVDDIARASLKLGPSVTVERIDGALHDIFLSRHEARELAYARMDHWVTGMIARR